jgi:hypothetical protein
LEEDDENSKGTEVSSSLVTTILREGGDGETKVGKSSKLSSLNQPTTSGEEITSKFYSFNLGEKKEYSTGKSSRLKFLEISTEGKRGALDTPTGVLKVESGK